MKAMVISFIHLDYFFFSRPDNYMLRSIKKYKHPETDKNGFSLTNTINFKKKIYSLCPQLFEFGNNNYSFCIRIRYIHLCML